MYVSIYICRYLYLANHLSGNIHIHMHTHTHTHTTTQTGLARPTAFWLSGLVTAIENRNVFDN